MDGLALFGFCFLGGALWIFNAEAAAAYFGSVRGWNPFLVGALCAGGQSLMHALLYFSGTQLAIRWPWFARRSARLRERFGDRLARGRGALAFTSGFLGLPPVSVTATLAPGFGLSAFPLLPLMAALRVVRFTLFAALGNTIGPWLGVTPRW